MLYKNYSKITLIIIKCIYREVSQVILVFKVFVSFCQMLFYNTGVALYSVLYVSWIAKLKKMKLLMTSKFYSDIIFST